MTNSPANRFTFDLTLIAPEAPDREARSREWFRIVAHYGPRLRDFFRAHVESGDELDELISHILRQASLRLHLIGHPDATWNWLLTTGRNELKQMARRTARAVRRQREHEHEMEVAANDVGSAVDDFELDDKSLGGRIPIDRTTLEARLAQLPPADRALLDFIVAGGTHVEAAAQLGLPSAAASRKRYSRLIAFLRTGVRPNS